MVKIGGDGSGIGGAGRSIANGVMRHSRANRDSDTCNPATGDSNRGGGDCRRYPGCVACADGDRSSCGDRRVRDIGAHIRLDQIFGRGRRPRHTNARRAAEGDRDARSEGGGGDGRVRGGCDRNRARSCRQRGHAGDIGLLIVEDRIAGD